MVASLLHRSSLTRTQLETLLIGITSKKLEKANSRLAYRGVSKGAFYRTLYQARRNVESAVYTILLIEYIGYVPVSCLADIRRVGESLKKIKERRISDEQVASILTNLGSLVEAYSGKRKLIV